MKTDENNLIDKAKNGDIEAFELLISSYQKRVFNMALRMIGNHDDASELSQEVFIRVFRSIRSFRQESQFSTWIFRITSNVCLDELRRRKNKKVIYIDEEIKLNGDELKYQYEADIPSPEDMVIKREMRKIVEEAINELPDNSKIIIIMRDIQGFSYEEIARILKSPEGTVKSRISRARQTLKAILESKKELFYDECVE